MTEVNKNNNANAASENNIKLPHGEGGGAAAAASAAGAGAKPGVKPGVKSGAKFVAGAAMGSDIQSGLEASAGADAKPGDPGFIADIVGIGSPVMDLLINVARIPTKEGGTRANEIFHQGGGNCASAMATVGRLGKKVGIIGKVGGDATGDFVIRDLAYNGVDTSRLIRGAPDTSSSYCVCISETELGTRKFIGRPSTVGRITPEEIPYDYIKTAKILHVEAGGDPASVAGAKFAKENGGTVSVDAGYFSENSRNIIPYVDIFIASEFFYNGMFPDDHGPSSYRKNFEKILEMGPSVVWVTLGERGCVGLVDGVMHEIPSFKVPVVDTTGAGDDFHGAYIAIMLEGLPHEECARHASAVAAIKCTFVGGRTGLPDRAMLKRFLEEGVLPTAELQERLHYYRTSFLK